MCLYPRLLENRKYRANKKNGGRIPPIKDHRTRYVPVGCQTCLECRKQKAREWQTRLQEDIKTNKNGKFITLTFSTESLKKLIKPEYQILKNSKWKFAKPPYAQRRTRPRKNKTDLINMRGYELDNAICVKAMRLFLERWRKKYKKSLRHWMVTEIGGEHSEHVHMHGIMWTDNVEDISKIWGYGYVWTGYESNTTHGKMPNYVSPKTVNYIVKYISKMDEKHLNYKPSILTSPGIGGEYTNTFNAFQNRFNNEKTIETYRVSTGGKMALPIYWRNKIYTEEQREKLWIQKLDIGERYVCGEKIEKDDEETYYNLLEYHRARTRKLGYPDPDFIWSKKGYEEQRRQMLQEKRLKLAGMIMEEN